MLHVFYFLRYLATYYDGTTKVRQVYTYLYYISTSILKIGGRFIDNTCSNYIAVFDGVYYFDNK